MGEGEGRKERSGGNRTGKAPASKRSGRLSRTQVNDLAMCVIHLIHEVSKLQGMLELINDSMTVESVRKLTDSELDIPQELWDAVLADDVSAPAGGSEPADNRRGEHGETHSRNEAAQGSLSFYSRRS